jgi:hypothetical protein
MTNRYKVKGIFCTWSCAGAYAIKEYGTLSHLYLFRRELGLDSIFKIAPDKIVLKAFGGPMSIKEFREYGEILGSKENHKL